jgi:small redox-active disulfide protein 2
MKKLKILGPGCPRCKKLAELTEEAAKSAGIEYELEKVTDIQKIAEYGVMSTPVLMVDEQVKISGKVPTVTELIKILS